MRVSLLTTVATAAALVLASGCARQLVAQDPVTYRPASDDTAVLRHGLAYAPGTAPAVVYHAIEAGNRLQRMPYKLGGGHAHPYDYGYDCSGTVSYVLREAGLIEDAMPSKGYFNYGEKGPGRWITIYVCRGHVFMTVAGLRLDTGGDGAHTGPRWKPEIREARGLVLRHPPGL